MWKLIYVNTTRISVGRQQARFMRRYNILLFLSEKKLPNTVLVFPPGKIHLTIKYLLPSWQHQM